jgi:hypothetical protein
VAAAAGALVLTAASIPAGAAGGERWHNPPHPAGHTVVDASSLSLPASAPCTVTAGRPVVWTKDRWPRFAIRVHNPCRTVAYGVLVMARPAGQHHPSDQTGAVALAGLQPGATTVVTDQFGSAADGDAPTVAVATTSVQVTEWLPPSALHHPPAAERSACQLLGTSVTVSVAVTHDRAKHGWAYTTITLHARDWPKLNHTPEQTVVVAAVGAHGHLLAASDRTVFPNEPKTDVTVAYPPGTRKLVAYWQPTVL